MPFCNSNRLPLLAAIAFAALVQASCFNDASIYTVSTEHTDDGKVILKPRVVRVNRHREAIAAPGPKARVDNPVHDFGRLNPLTKHRHIFVIYNDGDAPLELTEGPTTCKCTVAHLAGGSVPSGGKAHVSMQWNTGRDRAYSQSATLYTNDPVQPIIKLKLKGLVEVLLRCEPAELVFSRVAPGEKPSASTVIYSQMWDALKLTRVESDVPGVEHTIEAASAEAIAALGAKAAVRLTVTLPHDLPEGYFTIPIQITARRTDQVEDDGVTEADTELVLQGKVLRRLSVYGPAVDTRGTIMMGRVPQGQGTKVSLLLKMRDDLKDLNVTKIQTFPEWLQVRIEPYRQDQPNDVGLYRVHVEVPRDAPTFRLPPNRRGRIRIEFDHPRVPVLDLPVDLTVTPLGDEYR